MSNLYRALFISSMLTIGMATLGARRSFALPAAGVTAESSPLAPPAAEPAPDRDADLYNQGTTALNAGQWQPAFRPSTRFSNCTARMPMGLSTGMPTR